LVNLWTGSGPFLIKKRQMGVKSKQVEPELSPVNYTEGSGANLEGHLEGIDTALGNIGDLLTDHEQIYYVGKHGDSGNDGLTMETAFDTFGDAITAASGQTPSSSNMFTIYCDDSGIYTEDVDVPAWVKVRAESATINGNHTLADNADFRCYTISVSSGSAVNKNSGSGDACAEVDYVVCTGSANGLVSTSGKLCTRFGKVFVENGTGVGSNSGDDY